MKNSLKLFLPVLVATILFTSCSDDNDNVIDTQRPEIVINEPHDEDEFAPGDQINVEAVFTDNVELSSYKIEIHDDFDDHTHAYVKSAQDLNPWSFEETFNIPAGRTTFNAAHTIPIPTNIAEGRYHFGIFLTDTAGNQTEAFAEIHIEAHAEDGDH